MRQLTSFTSLSIAVSLLYGTASVSPAIAQEFAGRDRLPTHSSEFRKEVITVTDGVYVAVGFSNANAALIAGDGGAIIVDTTSDVADASEVRGWGVKKHGKRIRG